MYKTLGNPVRSRNKIDPSDKHKTFIEKNIDIQSTGQIFSVQFYAEVNTYDLILWLFTNGGDSDAATYLPVKKKEIFGGEYAVGINIVRFLSENYFP